MIANTGDIPKSCV